MFLLLFTAKLRWLGGIERGDFEGGLFEKKAVENGRKAVKWKWIPFDWIQTDDCDA